MKQGKNEAKSYWNGGLAAIRCEMMTFQETLFPATFPAASPNRATIDTLFLAETKDEYLGAYYYGTVNSNEINDQGIQTTIYSGRCHSVIELPFTLAPPVINL